MLPSVLPAGSLDDLFIHVDLFVFPPLAEHNKGGGGGISKSGPTVRKWPSILRAQDRVSQCLCNDNEPAEPPVSVAR